MENKEFSYTYSAARQQELESIRNQYLPRQEDPMEQLRRLHRIPGRKAQTWTIAMGVIGALLLGSGMSLCMTELGRMIGLSDGLGMLVGICLGITGLALVALAYPAYNRILRRQRRKIAPEILRLSDELMK